MSRLPADLTTTDALLGGALVYRQPASGYRVGVEAPLLAAFALPAGRRPPRTVCDLGAGAGAVGLCVARRLSTARITLVEADPFAARLAAENVVANGLEGRVMVREADVRGVDAALARGGFELVVSNPPWFFHGSGAAPPDPRRLAARHLGANDLHAFLASARQLLGRGGRACVTFPAASLCELLAALGALGLVAKRLRALHPRAGEPATAVFVEALAAKPGGLRVEPPWFLRGEGEAYSDELRALLWPPSPAG